jgi:predicted AAA+ superfamily ATPase
MLVGIRRSWKTFMLLDVVRQFLQTGVSRERIIHLSFEDKRLHPMRAVEFEWILQAHAELHPDLA